MLAKVFSDRFTWAGLLDANSSRTRRGLASSFSKGVWNSCSTRFSAETRSRRWVAVRCGIGFGEALHIRQSSAGSRRGKPPCCGRGTWGRHTSSGSSRVVSAGLGRTGVDRRVSSGNSSFLVLRRSAGSVLPRARKPLTLLDKSGSDGPARLAAVELLVGGLRPRARCGSGDRCGCTLSSPRATMRRTDLRLTCQRAARSCKVRRGSDFGFTGILRVRVVGIGGRGRWG